MFKESFCLISLRQLFIYSPHLLGWVRQQQLRPLLHRPRRWGLAPGAVAGVQSCVCCCREVAPAEISQSGTSPGDRTPRGRVRLGHHTAALVPQPADRNTSNVQMAGSTRQLFHRNFKLQQKVINLVVKKNTSSFGIYLMLRARWIIF